MPHRPDVFIYALGGGLGHVTRGIAIARQLLRLTDARIRLVSNSPFVAAVRDEVKRVRGLSLVALSPQATASEVATKLQQLLKEQPPQLLVVDTFPRGLGGELIGLLPALANTKKVLIGRALPEDYVAAYDLPTFVSQHYQLVIVPGESSCWETLPMSVRVPPIIIRERHELLAHEDAARQLRIAPHQECVLVVGSGTLPEIQQTSALVLDLASRWSADWPPLRLAVPTEMIALELSLRLHAPEIIIEHYPIGELFHAARILIGSAGYNLVHESHIAGVPLFAQVKQRLYDDQHKRIQQVAGVHPFVTLEELRELLEMELQCQQLNATTDAMEEEALPSADRNQRSGAQLAADHLLQLLQDREN